MNGAIYNVAVWGSMLDLASCEGVLRLRVFTLRSQHRDYIQGLLPGALVLLALLSKEEWKL